MKIFKRKESNSSLYDVMVSVYITCSAIWFKDGIKHDHQPFNIETGFVICGPVLTITSSYKNKLKINSFNRGEK